MNSAASVERRIAEMLAEEALTRAPEGTLAAVLERVDDVPQRRRSWPTSRSAVSRIDDRTRWIIGLAAALLVAGIVVAGALLLRPPDPLRDGSSLVIIARHTFTEGAPPTPVGVLAVAPDGSERTLMTIQPDQLDGAYSEWYAAVTADGYLVVPTSTEGGSSSPAVLDLRDPTAPAVVPDAEGAMAKVGPDGRLAMSQNDGRIAIFDPASGTTSWMLPGGLQILERDFGPEWTADGGLLATTGSGLSGGGIELLRADPATSTATPYTATYYTGLGPRRADRTGRLLRCDEMTDDVCADVGPTVLRAVDRRGSPVVWTQTDPSIRVIDFAWAVDGGVWLLTETAADGPRTVVLRHVGADSTVQEIATFSGSADDPDPGSYSSAGRFAAFSTNDARIVVELTGQPSSTLWSVDPRVRTATRLPDGVVAGWLAPDALTTPRRSVQRAPDLPDAIRGDWHHEGVVVEFRRRVVVVRSGGSVGSDATASVNASGMLEIQGQSGRCRDAVGTYDWAVDIGGLRLDPLEEPCAERAALLEGSFERAFGYPDTGGTVTTSGATYVAPGFKVPFRMTMPADRSTVVGSNQAAEFQLSTMIDGSFVSVTFLVPEAGVVSPCSPDTSGRTPFDPSSGIQSYLDGLTDITLEPAGNVAIGSTTTALVRPVARDPNACEQIALFRSNRSWRPYRVVDGARLGVVDRGDVDVVILVYSEGSDEAKAWLQELLGSIEWLP